MLSILHLLHQKLFSSFHLVWLIMCRGSFFPLNPLFASNTLLPSCILPATHNLKINCNHWFSYGLFYIVDFLFLSTNSANLFPYSKWTWFWTLDLSIWNLHHWFYPFASRMIFFLLAPLSCKITTSRRSKTSINLICWTMQPLPDFVIYYPDKLPFYSDH